LNGTITKHENPVESVNRETVILDAEGHYPRRIIIRDKGGATKEYRLVKTQSGNYILNR